MPIKNPKNKGSQFERDIARALSKWWMGDFVSDDVFWRTDSSGARHTIRKKQGKDTVNAAGDISSRCAEGDLFVKHFTVEIKRGYNKLDFLQLLDKPANKHHVFMGWWKKLLEECKTRNTYPMIIFKRDRCETCIAIDKVLFDRVKTHYGYDPHYFYVVNISQRNGNVEDSIILMNFERFLIWLPGPVLKEFLKQYENHSSS